MTALIKESGGWMMLRGVVALLFGLFAVFNPEGASGLFLTILAIYLLVDGLINIWIAFSNRDTANWGLLLAIGFLELAVAAITFARPEITGSVLAILIALWLLLKGTIEIVLGIDLRRELQGEWILILSGILAIITGLAFMVLPFTDSTAAIWLLGLYAIVYGTLDIADGYRVRQRADELAEVIEKLEQEGAAS